MAKAPIKQEALDAAAQRPARETVNVEVKEPVTEPGKLSAQTLAEQAAGREALSKRAK